MLKGGLMIKLSATTFALIIFVLMWGSLAMPPKQIPKKKGLLGFVAGAVRKIASKSPDQGGKSGSASQDDAHYNAWFQLYKASMIAIGKLGNKINRFLGVFSPVTSISQQEQQQILVGLRQSLQEAKIDIDQLMLKIKKQAHHLQKIELEILQRAAAFLKTFIVKQLEDYEKIMQKVLIITSYVEQLHQLMCRRDQNEKKIIQHEKSIQTKQEYRVRTRQLFKIEYKMQYFFNKLLTKILFDTICEEWEERKKYLLGYRKYFQEVYDAILQSKFLRPEEKVKLSEIIQRTQRIFAKLEKLFVGIESMCSGYMKLYLRNKKYFSSLRDYMLQATALWSIGQEVIPDVKFVTILDNCKKLQKSLRRFKTNLLSKKKLLEPEAMRILWRSYTILLSGLKFLKNCLLDEIKGFPISLGWYYDKIDTALHSQKEDYLLLTRYEGEKGKGVRWRQVLGQIWEMGFDIRQQGLRLMVNYGTGLPIYPQQVKTTISNCRDRLAILKIPRAKMDSLERQKETVILVINIVWRIANYFIEKQQQRELEGNLQTGHQP